MKHLLLPVLLILLSTPVKAQFDNHSYVGTSIQECRLKIKNIDEQVIYRTIYDFRGYQIELKESPECWIVLYFDKNGTLKKAKCKSYVEGEGSYTYYFENDVVIYANCFTSFPGEESFASRYVRGDGQILALQYTRYEEDELAEYSNKVFLSDSSLSLPTECGYEYDRVSDISTLMKYHHIDSLYMPSNKTVLVKFVAPTLGDKTTVLYNETPLFEKASIDAPVIAKLNVGDVEIAFKEVRFDIGTEVKIVEVINEEWCKVETRNLFYGSLIRNLTGYVQTKFLTPIEIKQ